MKKIIFLTSGNGGTLKYTYYAIKKLNLNFKIIAVIADRNCTSLKFAHKVGIPTKQIKYIKNKPKELQNSLLELSPDFIITNFHKIIDEQTLNLFPSKFINLHYSILPAFGGLIGMATLDEAKKCNTKFIGATCHYVSQEVDAGEIIGQCSLPVNWNLDDQSILTHTVFRSACLTFLNSLLRDNKTSNYHNIESSNVQFNPGLSFDASVFDNDFWDLIKHA